MNVFFAGQLIPFEILNDKDLMDNERLINTAGNSFYNNMLKGLLENNCRVTARSLVYGNVTDKYGLSAVVGGIDIKFWKYSCNPLKRYLKMFFGTINDIVKWNKSVKDNKIIIVNCLRIAQCIAAITAGKLTKNRILAVVTDVPGHRPWSGNISLLTRLNDKLGKIMLKAYDGFVFLSEDMNPVVNKKNKPYAVVEGLINPHLFDEIKEERYDTFTIMYAGALMRKYNILNLVEAVRRINDIPVKLILYGGGELEEELRELSESDSRIEYRGKALHSEILKEEKKSHLLVNPRSTNEEYTKLSFPSKNIEYMLSGTPVLFTKLKSMPEEYYDYIYTIDDETACGMSDKIKEIMALSEKERMLKGEEAAEFIKRRKNYIYQAEKVKVLLEEL